MASWCGNCSGQDCTIDDSLSINLSAALQLGVETRLEELQPGTHSGALTRWASDEQLWVTLMGERRRDGFPDDAMRTIRELFDGAW